MSTKLQMDQICLDKHFILLKYRPIAPTHYLEHNQKMVVVYMYLFLLFAGNPGTKPAVTKKPLTT